MSTETHITAEDLALYALGAAAAGDIAAIERHLGDCADCRWIVYLHRELLDLESVGLLSADPLNTSHSAETDQHHAPSEKRWPSIEDILPMTVLGVLGTGAWVHPLRESSLASSSPQAPSHSDRVFPHDHVRDPHSPISEVVRGGEHAPANHQTEKSPMVSYSSAFHEANPTFGMQAAAGTSEYVHQHYSDTCAVQCQRLILNQFGVGVTEDQLVNEAIDKGLYAPGDGTSLEDVGKLLEAHGIPVHREMDANVFHLATELAQGHKVIVGLDSGHLWHSHSILESIAEHFGIGGADHVVIVSGIDTADPDHVKVVVTDPGTGDVAKAYELPDFLDAWKGSHFSMVSTVHPVPAINPEMVNFDYHAGHIPNVGAVPYEMVSAMSHAAGPESDSAALNKLENVFDHIVSGDLSMGQLIASLGANPTPGHDLFHNLALGLLSIVHHTFSPSPAASLLEPFLTGSEHYGHDTHHDHTSEDAEFGGAALHGDHHLDEFADDATDLIDDSDGDS